jgi:hypothetical protein
MLYLERTSLVEWQSDEELLVEREDLQSVGFSFVIRPNAN